MEARALAEEHIRKLKNDRKVAVQQSISGFDMLSSYRAMLELLSSGQYTSPERIFFELLQNCDDAPLADADQDAGMKVLFRLLPPDSPEFKNLPASLKLSDHGILLRASNEVGFSKADVESICTAAISSKKSSTAPEGKKRAFIGEKGIGFKVVWRISDYPHIFSRGYRFKYKPESDKNKLHMITPSWCKDEQAVEYCRRLVPSDTMELNDESGTLMLFPLRPGIYGPLEQSLMSLGERGDNFLFLQKVRHIFLACPSFACQVSVVACPPLQLESFNFTNLVPAEQFKDVKYSDQPSTKTLQVSYWNAATNQPQTKEYLLSQFEFVIPDHITDEMRPGVKVLPMSLVFCLEAAEAQQIRKHGRIFAYLPTHEADLGYPCLINSDFILSTSRESFDKSKPWNSFIVSKAFPIAFLAAFSSLASFIWSIASMQGLENPVALLDLATLLGRSLPPFKSEGVLATHNTLLLTALSHLPWLLTSTPDPTDATYLPQVRLVAPRNAICAPSEVLDLLGYEIPNSEWSAAGITKTPVHLAFWKVLDDLINTSNNPLQLDKWVKQHWVKHILNNNPFLASPSHQRNWFQQLYTSLCCSFYFESKDDFKGFSIIPTHWASSKPVLVSLAEHIEQGADMAMLSQGLILPNLVNIIDPELWILLASYKPWKDNEMTMQDWCKQSMPISGFSRSNYLKTALTRYNYFSDKNKYISLVNLALRMELSGEPHFQALDYFGAWFNRSLTHISNPSGPRLSERSIDATNRTELILPPLVSPALRDLFGPFPSDETNLSQWSTSARSWLLAHCIHEAYFDTRQHDYCMTPQPTAEQLAGQIVSNLHKFGFDGLPYLPTSKDEPENLFPFLASDHRSDSWIQRFSLLLEWRSRCLKTCPSSESKSFFSQWHQHSWIPKARPPHTLAAPKLMYINMPREFHDAGLADCWPIPWTDALPLSPDILLAYGATDLRDAAIAIPKLSSSIAPIADKDSKSQFLQPFFVFCASALPKHSALVKSALENLSICLVDGDFKTAPLDSLIVVAGDSSASSLSHQHLWADLSAVNLTIWSEDSMKPELYKLLQGLQVPATLVEKHLLALLDALYVRFPDPSHDPSTQQHVIDFYWAILESLSEYYRHAKISSFTPLFVRPVLLRAQWIHLSRLHSCHHPSFLRHWHTIGQSIENADRWIQKLEDFTISRYDISALADGDPGKQYILDYLFKSHVKHLPLDTAINLILDRISELANAHSDANSSETDDSWNKPGFTEAAWALYETIFTQLNPSDMNSCKSKLSSTGIVRNRRMVAFSDLGWTGDPSWSQKVLEAMSKLSFDCDTALFSSLHQSLIVDHDLRLVCDQYMPETAQVRITLTAMVKLNQLSTATGCALLILRELQHRYPSAPSPSIPPNPESYLPDTIEGIAWQMYPHIAPHVWAEDAAASAQPFAGKPAPKSDGPSENKLLIPIYFFGVWRRIADCHYIPTFMKPFESRAPMFDHSAPGHPHAKNDSIHSSKILKIIKTAYFKAYAPSNLHFISRNAKLPPKFLNTIFPHYSKSCTLSETVIQILEKMRMSYPLDAPALRPAPSSLNDAAWLLYVHLASLSSTIPSDKRVVLLNSQWWTPADLVWLVNPSVLYDSLKPLKTSTTDDSVEAASGPSQKKTTPKQAQLPYPLSAINDLLYKLPRNVHPRGKAIAKLAKAFTPVKPPSLSASGDISTPDEISDKLREVFGLLVVKNLSQIPMPAHLEAFDSIAHFDFLLAPNSANSKLDHLPIVDFVNEWVCLHAQSLRKLPPHERPQLLPMHSQHVGFKFLPTSKLVIPSKTFTKGFEEVPEDTPDKLYQAALSEGPNGPKAAALYQALFGIPSMEQFAKQGEAELAIHLDDLRDMTQEWRMQEVLGDKLQGLIRNIAPQANWLPELLALVRTASILVVKEISHVRTFERVGLFRRPKSVRIACAEPRFLAWRGMVKTSKGALFPNDDVKADFLSESERRSNVSVEYWRGGARYEVGSRSDSFPASFDNVVFFSQRSGSSLKVFLNHILRSWFPEDHSSFKEIKGALNTWAKKARPGKDLKSLADRIWANILEDRQLDEAFKDSIEGDRHLFKTEDDEEDENTDVAQTEAVSVLAGSQSFVSPAYRARPRPIFASQPGASPSSSEKDSGSQNNTPSGFFPPSSGKQRFFGSPSSTSGTPTRNSLSGSFVIQRTTGAAPGAPFDGQLTARPGFQRVAVQPQPDNAIPLGHMFSSLLAAVEQPSASAPAVASTKVFSLSPSQIASPSQPASSIPQNSIQLPLSLEDLGLESLIEGLQLTVNHSPQISRAPRAPRVHHSLPAYMNPEVFIYTDASGLSFEQLGRWGEDLAQDYLAAIDEFKGKCIVWVNKDRESGHPFDYVVYESQDKLEEPIAFIEVKTSGSTNNFFWSLREFHFASQFGSSYYLLHIRGSPLLANDRCSVILLHDPIKSGLVVPIKFQMTIRA